MGRIGFVLSLLVFLLPTGAGAAEAPSSASPVSATISRADMTAILQTAGLTEISDGTSDEAWPWIVGKTSNGLPIEVDFYRCEPGTGPQRPCGQLRFKVTWNNLQAIDAKTVALYNEKYVFGRGVVTSDGKFVSTDYALNLDGGVTRDYLLKNLTYFMISVNDFMAMVKP